MGVPASTPAVDPTVRWNPGLPDLIGAARYASKQAAHNPDWVGSTQVFTHLAEEPTSISIRPVFLSGHLIGSLIAFGASDGEQLAPAGGVRRIPVRRARLVGMRDNRMVLLRSVGGLLRRVGRQRRVAGHRPGHGCAPPPRAWTSWTAELAEAGFLRVHRRYVVNLNRVREVERGFKGEMSAGHGRPGDGHGAGLPAQRRRRCGGRWASDSREDSRVRHL